MTEPGRVPDFIGIGAQRAGTTWLQRNLSRHRDAHLFRAFKEVHYFDLVHIGGAGQRAYQLRRLAAFARWLDAKGKATAETTATLAYLRSADLDDTWYRRLFTLAPANKLCGEITPSYSILPPEGIAHMLRVNPDVKLILVLRHPVERAWSNVRFDLKADFKEAADPRDVDVSTERLRSLALAPYNRIRTDYPTMLQRYRAAVEPEQLLVTFYDRIQHDPVGLLTDVAAFLELDPDRFRLERINTRGKRNKAPDVVMADSLGRELADLYRDDLAWLVRHVDGVPADWIPRLERYARAAP